MILLQSLSFDTSPLIPTTFRLVASEIDSARALISDSFVLVIITEAPACASASAIIAPSPLDPPVTKATRSVISKRSKGFMVNYAPGLPAACTSS